MASPKEPSLLGLPRELRLQIYECVSLLDLNYTVITRWRQHSGSYGFRSFAELNKQQKLVVSWLNLMLTCRTIAIELRASMKEQTTLEDEISRTYVVDLEARGGGKSLGAVTWRRLPCAPEQARYLEAHYNSRKGFRAWGDGGPQPIIAGLYQTLNHLLHCGPRFDSKFELPSLMHLKELRIVIESRGIEGDKDEYAKFIRSDIYANAERAAFSLGGVVGQINHTGVLRSCVDRVKVSVGERVLRYSSDDSKNTGIPREWDRYGFDWGIEVYREDRGKLRDEPGAAERKDMV